jgi:hypothetical protein
MSAAAKRSLNVELKVGKFPRIRINAGVPDCSSWRVSPTSIRRCAGKKKGSKIVMMSICVSAAMELQVVGNLPLLNARQGEFTLRQSAEIDPGKVDGAIVGTSSRCETCIAKGKMVRTGRHKAKWYTRLAWVGSFSSILSFILTTEGIIKYNSIACKVLTELVLANTERH